MIVQINQQLADAVSAADGTRRLEIGTGMLSEVPRIFSEVFGYRQAVVVADDFTFATAGRAVHSAFCASGEMSVREPFLFPAQDVSASFGWVTNLTEALRDHDAIPVAVGSGTINDLVKLASFQANRPYMCVATAASMDGYTAFGASITHEGLKQTFHCPAPVAVVADLEVIRNAPKEMSASGYADLLAKVTAGADWIVADALGVETIDAAVWPIVQERLRLFLADPKGVRAGDTEALGKLVEGLMLGGFAMQATRSSRPASGAEHQFSHLWDMQRHTHRGGPPSHGFKVGIGALASTALYETLFSLPVEAIEIEPRCANWPTLQEWRERADRWHPDEKVAKGVRAELTAKHCEPDELRRLLETLRDVWPDLTKKLRKQLLPFTVLKRMLTEAGAPVEPEEIGISRERLRASYWQAFSIRRRFTVLDLAVRAGLLDRCLDCIFGPGGVWPVAGPAVRTETISTSEG